MIRGITRQGMGAVESDEQLIRAAAQYGFGAVDVDARGLVARGGADGARELLQQHGVILGAINLNVEWRSDEAKFRDGLARLADDAAAAAALGCTRCCTYILPSTDLPSAHFMALTTRRLRTCAQVLGAYGVRLGLEFVGPHHLRTRWANPFIWTLQETLDWIDAIGESNVGLLFDSYHWYTNGLGLDDIAALRADQLVHVHINDAPDVPVHEALDNGRLYPGEGVIDLPGFLRALRAIGYNGVIAQEVLMQSPPSGSLDELLQRSRSGFDSVYKLAGL